MDQDTPAENLSITVATPDSGFLSLASNLSHPVSSFTQADVNNKRLYFTHTGKFPRHCRHSGHCNFGGKLGPSLH